MGDVRCGRTERGKSYPQLPGYTTIPAWSRGAAPWKELSPMFIGPLEIREPLPLRPGFTLSEDGSEAIGRSELFENYWQGSKIYRVDLIEPEKEITIENLKPSFWDRRAEVFASEKGMRRALPKARYGVPIAGYYRGVVMEYIPSRKLVYAPLYANLLLVSPVAAPIFRSLEARHLKGENLIIVGPDGYDHNIPLSKEILDQLIDDPRRPFGHELVICGMLLGQSYQ